MSRRRDPKPPSAVEGEFVPVQIVCTGRRRHEQVSFGVVDYFPGSETGDIRLIEQAHYVDGAAGITDWSSDNFLELEKAMKASHRTYPLLCGRCRPVRNVPLTQATILRLCAGLVAAGETRLDLSALGAIGAISL